MSPIPTPGTVLAGKYRIDSVLGAGGMGVVFAATHAHLEEQVAIKLLNPETAARPGAVARFVREARVAMRLRGEHVVRILDVGMLPTGAPFIVMEYLIGRDLRAVLRAEGKLERTRAVDYVLQVCEAIAEAHAHGVVHRDLKPPNLFLTKRLDGVDCIKVLDFGVSKINADFATASALSETAPGSTKEPGRPADEAFGLAATIEATPGGVTQTRSLVGSPRYMAPEQLQSARDVDARADIWALGVVLFELLTGAPPFNEDTFDALLSSVMEKATPVVEGVPAPLAAAVARALAKKPGDRFQDARSFAEAIAPFGSDGGKAVVLRIGRVVRTLEGARKGDTGAAPGGDFDPAAAPSRGVGSAKTPFQVARTLGQLAVRLPSAALSTLRHRPRILGLTCLALLGAAALAGSALRQRTRAAAYLRSIPTEANGTRRSLAILPFTAPESGAAAAWPSIEATEILTASLAIDEPLRVLPGVEVARRAIGFDVTGGASIGERQRLGRALGADLMVFGALFRQGDRLRVGGRVVNATTGEALTQDEEIGPADDVAQTALRLGETLRQRLGGGALGDREREQVRAHLPRDADAARQYAEGLAYLRRYEARAALDHLEEAARHAPNFAFIQAAIAEAAGELALPRAKEASAAAVSDSASADLTREERLLMEAQAAYIAQAWKDASDRYRALHAFYPDERRYALGLASSLARETDFDQAASVLDTLRKEAPDDPEVWVESAKLSGAQGNTDELRSRAERAADLATRGGNLPLTAAAWALEAGAAYDRLDIEGAERAFDQATLALTRVGDEVGLAKLGDQRAYALVRAGKNDEAEKVANLALVAGRRLGNLDVQRDALNVLGRVAQMHGDMRQAESLWREALGIAKTLEDRSLIAGELCNVALATMEEGNVVLATTLYEEAATEARAVKAEGTLTKALENLAIAWTRRDQFGKARDYAEEAVAGLRARGSLSSLPYALDSLGEIEESLLHFDKARAALNEAITIQEKAGNKAGRSRHILAEVALEEGKWTEAEELGRQAVSEFKAEGVEQVVFGLASLTMILLRERKFEEASATMTELLETAERSGDDEPRKQYVGFIARIDFALGKRTLALKLARDAVDEATRRGTLGESGSLEVRVALGEMSLLVGDRATGIPLLRAAEAEARAGQNLLLAARARRALAGQPSIG